MSDWPTTSRMALSATSFTVVSGFWMLKRYFVASWMRQNTTKLTSTMFSSPLSIRLSSRTLVTAPEAPRAVRPVRMPISMMFCRVTLGSRTSSIG